MADPEHEQILKQGVAAWNAWRKANPRVRPYLDDVVLRDGALSGIDLHGASLNQTDFVGTDLSNANLSGAELQLVHLSGCDCTGTSFSGTLLHSAYLNGANCSNSSFDEGMLIHVDFTRANLSFARFHKARIYDPNFLSAALSKADFAGAVIRGAIFANNDLSQVKGLAELKHMAPSFLSVDSLLTLAGQVPDTFLRACGVPEALTQSMFGASASAIEFYSCFISHSTRDSEFATKLYRDFQHLRIKCWYAPEDLKIGDKFRLRIDESIRLHDKLLLVLSEDSVSSDWVEKEVETAMERERQEKRTVLFPIRIDDAVMNIPNGWPADIRRTRHIGDFRKWKNHDDYQRAFDRLLRDLKDDEGSGRMSPAS